MDAGRGTLELGNRCSAELTRLLRCLYEQMEPEHRGGQRRNDLVVQTRSSVLCVRLGSGGHW
jgi:hypothetical protein